MARCILPFVSGIWFKLTLAFYAIGIYIYPSDVEGKYFFTAAAFTVVFALRAALLLLEPHFRISLPALSERTYAKESGVYFFIAVCIGLLIIGMILFSSRLEQLAEHLAMILYFSLVIGIGYEVAFLKRFPPDQKDEKDNLDS